MKFVFLLNSSFVSGLKHCGEKIIGNLNTILLVEDDKMVRQTLRENLEREDFLIMEACNGKRSVEILKHHQVSLVLLDLNLPDSRGLEFVSAVRQETNVPLIIVSGESDDRKKVKSIEAGADDFISKPVNIDMLIAKINAHIRRFENPLLETDETRINAAQKPNAKFGAGLNEWEIDTQKFQIFDKDGKPADLTTREFQLLGLLIDNADRTLSRDELCEAIREQNYVPSARAIDVKITRIRKKIGDNATAPEIIKTVRGIGYMFNKEKLI